MKTQNVNVACCLARHPKRRRALLLLHEVPITGVPRTLMCTPNPTPTLVRVPRLAFRSCRFLANVGATFAAQASELSVPEFLKQASAYDLASQTRIGKLLKREQSMVRETPGRGERSTRTEGNREAAERERGV